MNRLTLLALQILVAVVFLLIWHVFTVYPLLGDTKTIQFFFSTPLQVLGRTWTQLTGGDIYFHLGITLTETVLAFVIGSAAGVFFGFTFARRQLMAAVFDPYIKAANALPRVVLAPIFALWFGLGIWSKVALGFTLVFFIVFFNVYQGVREVSPTVLANARMLGMNERQQSGDPAHQIFSVSPPRGCQTSSRRSASVTPQSRRSAKAVSTTMPANTALMSKVPSACRIR